VRGRPEETRRRILAAASKLFYAHGIRAVGVDTIAAEAGVTKRTLYKHYAGKDVLIAAYLEGRDQPVLAALIQSASNASGGIVAQIESLYVSLEAQARNPRWHGCPFARAVSELREHENEAVRAIAGRHKHAFEQWLEDHLAAADIDRPARLAQQLMVLLDGTITQLLIHRDASYASAAAAAAVLLVEQHLPG